MVLDSNPTVAINFKIKTKIFQYSDNRTPEDGSRGNFRNVVCNIYFRQWTVANIILVKLWRIKKYVVTV